jgi:hypothetical protein
MLFVVVFVVALIAASDGVSLQCVINTPTRDVDDEQNIYSGIQHAQEFNSSNDGGYPDVCIKLSGNSVVFDSFSPTETVSKLNVKINNISRAGDSSCRFPTKFSVNVEGDITAILSDVTVDNYMIVDKQTHRPILAPTRRNIEKQPAVKSNPSNMDPVNDSATMTTNASSSSEASPHNASPMQQQQFIPVQLPQKRPLERTPPPIRIQAPVYRFAMQPTNAPLIRPYASNFTQPPQLCQVIGIQPPSAVTFRPKAVSRPTVILDKPTYTNSDMKPLFAPSDECDPPPAKKQQLLPRTVFNYQSKPATFPVSTSPPSPPDFNKRPVASPSMFSPGNARFSSGDLIRMGGTSFRKSSSETPVCVVSVKDMLNMELPRIDSRISSQDEVCIANPRSRIPSTEGSVCNMQIGSRAASLDEISAVRTLAHMRS